MPRGVELVGAVPWLPTRTTDNTRRWDPEVIKRSTVKHGDVAYTRNTITMHHSLLRLRPDSVSWGYRERVYLRTWPGLGAKSATAHWKVMTREYDPPSCGTWGTESPGRSVP